MREHYYQRRLKQDLEKWVGQGRISKKSADDILKDIPSSGLAERLPSVIAILGAVLICFGILAFVAANWYGVPKAVRLALLAAGMWSAYGCAVILHKRGSLWLFETVILIGVGIFATGIVLIAQMYHIDGHYPDAILMAGTGALVAACLARSTSALVIAIAAVTLWTSMETLEFNREFHWPFLFAWSALAATTYYLKSRLGYHLVTLSFTIWATLTIFMQTGVNIWTFGGAISQLASLAYIVLTIALIYLHYRRKTNPNSFACPLTRYAVTALVVLIFVVQMMETKSFFINSAKSGTTWAQIPWLTGSFVLVAFGILVSIIWRKKIGYSAIDLSGLILIGITAPFFSFIGVNNLSTLIPLAICVFLISIWLIVFGQDFVDRNFVNLGFLLFAAETLYIYFRTFGTLMNSFVFFTIGGIILISLALGLDRFRKRIYIPSTPSAGDP